MPDREQGRAGFGRRRRLTESEWHDGLVAVAWSKAKGQAGRGQRREGKQSGGEAGVREGARLVSELWLGLWGGGDAERAEQGVGKGEKKRADMEGKGTTANDARHGGIRGTEALSLGVVCDVPGLERSCGAEQRGEVKMERELRREGATGA